MSTDLSIITKYADYYSPWAIPTVISVCCGISQG